MNYLETIDIKYCIYRAFSVSVIQSYNPPFIDDERFVMVDISSTHCIDIYHVFFGMLDLNILHSISKNKSFYCTTLLLIDDEVLVKVDRSNTHRRDIYLRRALDECMK